MNGRWMTLDTVRWLRYQQHRSVAVALVFIVGSLVISLGWSLVFLIPTMPLWVGYNLWIAHKINKLERRVAKGEKIWLPYSKSDQQIDSQGWSVP